MKIYEAKVAYLYVVKCGPFYKVGFSVDPVVRTANIQTNCPIRVKLVFCAETTKKAAPKAEYAAHLALEQYRHRDEWFRAPFPVIRAAILKAIEETEVRGHPNVTWYEPGQRPIMDRSLQ